MLSLLTLSSGYFFNPVALRKAKIVYNFGLSECKRVNKPAFVMKAFIMFLQINIGISHFSWTWSVPVGKRTLTFETFICGNMFKNVNTVFIQL